MNGWGAAADAAYHDIPACLLSVSVLHCIDNEETNLASHTYDYFIRIIVTRHNGHQAKQHIGACKPQGLWSSHDILTWVVILTQPKPMKSSWGNSRGLSISLHLANNLYNISIGRWAVSIGDGPKAREMAMKSHEDTNKKTLPTWGKGHCHQDKNDGNQGNKDSGEQVVVIMASMGTLRT